ncbi:MAG: MFS transporter [Synergistales bacterium]|nr:MFS transporter [Synergistales bacterium]
MRKTIARITGATYGIMCFGNIYFLLAPYLVQHGVTAADTIGWILGMYFATSTLTRPFGAWVVERFDFRPTLVTAALICAAGSAGVALAGNNVAAILVWRALTGFGSSLYVVGLTTYQTLVIPDETRGSAFTFISAGNIAPLVTIVPVAEWILHHGHPQLYIWLPTVAALACLVLAFSLQPPPMEQGGGKRDWGTYREVFTHRPVRVLFLTVVLFAFIDASVVSIASLAMERGLMASFFISGNAGMAVAIRMLGFKLMDRLPRLRLPPLAFACTSLTLMGATFADSNLAFGVWGVLFGIAMGFGFPLNLALIGDVAPPRLRPKVTSLVWFCMAGSFFLSPVVTGYLATWAGPSVAFRILATVIAATALPVYLLLWKPIADSRAQEKRGTGA